MADDEIEGVYVQIADVRAVDGFEDVEAYPDPVIEASIRLQTRLVDKITHQWFVPVEKSLLLDGDGSPVLMLDFPIIELDELYVDEVLVPVAHRRVYNGNSRGNDDRDCPMIELVTGMFREGSQNVRVVGTFGFVEDDGSIPEPIKYATLKLVIRDLQSPPGGGESSGGGAPVGPKTSETTDGHSVSFAAPAVTGMRIGTLALTGDPQVDKILELYRAPQALAAV